MVDDKALVKVDAFNQALAEAKTIPEVKDLADQADLVKQWLKKQRVGREAQNTGAVLCLMAQRKLGMMLGEQVRNPGDTDKAIMLHNATLSPTLSELGIERTASHRWQKLAEIPEPEFQEFISTYQDSQEEITTIALIRFHAKTLAPEEIQDWLPLPEGRYRTLVIDPPWPIDKILRDSAPNQYHMDYGTKSIDEITKLDIPSKTANDGTGTHVYLWTTQKYLPIAFNILTTWGLTYVFTMVWHKDGGFQPFNLPQYNCEFIIFARSSGLEFLDTKNFFTCFNAKRREHSRKPSEFYELVKRVSPTPRLDIFSRGKYDGFDQYGYEPDKF